MNDDLRELIDLLESKAKQKLTLEKLPCSRGGFVPVWSQALVDYHYGELARGYVDRYNNGEGDASFNEAGALLHNIFFTQLRPPKTNNQPYGRSAALIDKKFDSFKKFKEEFKEQALKIQGSGWIYLSKTGSIKIIRNHEKRYDIALIIDFWEHAYNRDYGANKSKYFDNFWRIVNWDIINQRL